MSRFEENSNSFFFKYDVSPKRLREFVRIGAVASLLFFYENKNQNDKKKYKKFKFLKSVFSSWKIVQIRGQIKPFNVRRIANYNCRRDDRK